MANFRRKRPRLCSSNNSGRGSPASWRAKHGLKPIRDHWRQEKVEWHPYIDMMGSWPAWWDRTFHTRPKRIETRRLENQILRGADPDEMTWPLANHKPHKYYW